MKFNLSFSLTWDLAGGRDVNRVADFIVWLGVRKQKRVWMKRAFTELYPISRSL